jgi:drug/metabolite transporter (DMT)-like permease
VDDSEAAGGATGRNAGLPLALISALAFGGSGVAAKPLIESGLDPLDVVWLRATGAALIMLPLLWRHRAAVLRRPAVLAGFGLLAVAGVQGCYFAAISRIPVGVALLIEYLAPALVLGWVRFVQRKPVSRGSALGVVLAVVGLVCVVRVWSGLAFDTWGLLLGLCAACCQAGYFILADRSGAGEHRLDPMAISAYGLFIGACALTVVARPWGMHWHLLARQAQLGDHRVPAVLLLGWVVLVATVLAYMTGIVAVRRLTPQVAGVVSCLEAVIATVLAWVLLDEYLSPVQLLGGGVVLAGALVAQASPRRAADRSPAPVPDLPASDLLPPDPGRPARGGGRAEPEGATGTAER